MDTSELELTLGPYRNLLRLTETIFDLTAFQKFRWFGWLMDDFTWVYGVSEVEIKDFSTRYEATRQTLRTAIENSENPKLKTRLERELQSLYEFKLDRYVSTSSFTLTLLVNQMRLLKKLWMTIEFRSLLDDTKRTCERIISLYENVKLLELVEE